MAPKPAKLSKRAAAFFLDEILGHTLLTLLGSVVPVLGNIAASLVYSALQDTVGLGRGRSLGRAAVKQRLARLDGSAVPIHTAILRNALRWVMWLTGILFVVDVVMALASRDGRLIVDHIFDTCVYEEDSLEALDAPRAATSSSAYAESDLGASVSARSTSAETATAGVKANASHAPKAPSAHNTDHPWGEDEWAELDDFMSRIPDPQPDEVGVGVPAGAGARHGHR